MCHYKATYLPIMSTVALGRHKANFFKITIKSFVEVLSTLIIPETYKFTLSIFNLPKPQLQCYGKLKSLNCNYNKYHLQVC